MHVMKALGLVLKEALASPVPFVYSVMLTSRLPSKDGAATRADTLYC